MHELNQELPQSIYKTLKLLVISNNNLLLHLERFN